MIRSMTGFGRALADDTKRSFLVEMKAVNQRYLDVNIRMPKSLLALEEKVRKVVGAYIFRGRWIFSSPTAITPGKIRR